MRVANDPVSPELWLNHMFSAKSAISGGVVRRSVKDMERNVGRARFLFEIERRGFSAVENAGQIVVFCNAQPLRQLVGGAKSSPRI